MKKLYVLLIILLTVSFSLTVIAQDLGLLKKGYKISFPEKIHKLVLDPLPAGTYSVGAGGYFPTIDSAFNKLSIDGVGGEVILELIDNLYTAPTNQYGFFLNGPIPGAGPNSRVTIKPADNKNVIIEGNGMITVSFYNTNYVTIDGIALSGSTTLTIHTFHNPSYNFNDGIDFVHNCNHNVMQNIIFINEDAVRPSGSGFLAYSGELAPDSNLIQYNFIRQAGAALYAYGNPDHNANGNIIRGNIIGTETDSLIAFGIIVFFSQNTIIENNIIQNLRLANPYDASNVGIISLKDSGDIIRNNVVHNIKSSSGYSSMGILLSGAVSYHGSNNSVYNNMIYDIQSTSPDNGSRVTGIQMWHQDNPKIYYNSVYLSGTGANHYGSAALYIWNGCTNVELKNNIFVNTRDESPYCASSIYDFSASNLTSNNNDLYYEQNQYNCLVRIEGNDYHTLADWQATGQDTNSITEMPNFIDPHLHISDLIPTYIEAGGIPISGIETDIDGDQRRIDSTDIGADEFNGIRIPVELTSFTALVNNIEIMLNWSTATEINNRGFEIQRSIEGKEFFTVGFVNGHGTTTEQQNYSYADKILNNGKYYYRLKQVDYNGSYEYSNVVEVEMSAVNSFLLEQNYPNPFNPATTIGFGIKNKSNVKITVLNLIGEEVAVILNEVKEAGYHQVVYTAVNLSSGVYFYRIKAGNFIQAKKMILLK